MNQVANIGDWVVYNNLTQLAIGYPLAVFNSLFRTALVNISPAGIPSAEMFGRVTVA
jgi:hypothetical protein